MSDLVHRLKSSLHKVAVEQCRIYLKKRLPDLDRKKDEHKTRKILELLFQTLEKCVNPEMLQFKRVIGKYEEVRLTGL